MDAFSCRIGSNKTGRKQEPCDYKLHVSYHLNGWDKLILKFIDK